MLFGDSFAHRNTHLMQGIPDFIEKAITQPEPAVKPAETTPVETKVETSATTTVVTDTPVVTTPTTTETKSVETTPVFDFKTIDERITSADDIKRFLSERDTYSSELEQTKTKLSQFDNYIKPNSDFVTKLNEIEASGGNVDLFLQMRNIDPQSLTEVDAVKLLMQFQDGLTSQDADRKVKILYKQGKDLKAIEQEITELRDVNNVEKYNPKEASRLEEEMENIYLAQAELKVAGKKAIQSLSDLKVKSQEVPNIQKIQDDIKASWQPHVPKFIPKDLEIPFKIENPDKSVTDLNIKFTVDGAAQKDINEFLQGTVEYFASQGIPYDEQKAMQMLTQEVKSKILGKNFDKIANQMVNTALEAERLRVKDAIHATPKTGEKVENNGKETDKVATEFFNIVKSSRNGVLV